MQLSCVRTPSPMRLRVENALGSGGTVLPGMSARRFVVRCDGFPVTRSRDVATLYANMTFDPAKINLQQVQYHCERGSRRATCVTTEVCFSYWVKSDQQAPHSTAGEPLSTAPRRRWLGSHSPPVLQKSATTCRWTLCVRRPGPHSSKWTIKASARSAGSSTSATGGRAACRKPS